VNLTVWPPLGPLAFIDRVAREVLGTRLEKRQNEFTDLSISITAQTN